MEISLKRKKKKEGGDQIIQKIHFGMREIKDLFYVRSYVFNSLV